MFTCNFKPAYRSVTYRIKEDVRSLKLNSFNKMKNVQNAVLFHVMRLSKHTPQSEKCLFIKCNAFS